MAKILVVDGNSIMHRAFWATPNLTTNGQPINAVLTFLNILYRTSSDIEAENIIVAFDAREKTFRHKLYDEYKAGRQKTPDELNSQFPIIKEFLETLGASVVECSGYEADDILGTVAKQKSDDEVYLMTGDRDSFQLVSDKTSVLYVSTKMGRHQARIYTPRELELEYNLTPEQYIEYKAVLGDKSDNIIGVNGVGEKRAAELFEKYGSIAGIYQNIEKLTPAVREAFLEFQERMPDVLTLVTINKNAPIDKIDLQNYNFYSTMFLDKLLEYNLKSLHKRLRRESEPDAEQMGFL